MRLPCVLGIGTQDIVIEIVVLRGVANGTGLRIAQKEVGEVVARTRNRKAILKFAGDFSGKVVRAAAVGVAIGRQVVPPVDDAKLEAMLSANQVDAIAKVLALIAGEQRYAIAERTEVGEVKSRWAVVYRIRGRALNAKLHRDVRAVREVRYCVRIIAVKDHPRIIEQHGRERVSPLEGSIQTVATNRIEKLERLGVVR